MPDAEEPAVRPAASSSTNDLPSRSFINEGSETVYAAAPTKSNVKENVTKPIIADGNSERKRRRVVDVLKLGKAFVDTPPRRKCAGI